ncbi:MAG TPA: thioredoxin-like domain-containing protein [Pseudomonadales bacterium]
MTALTVTLVLLWIVTVALAAMVYALARQIGTLYERVAPAGALAVNAAVKTGDPAPEFELTTLADQPIRIGGVEHPQLLFFLAPDCPICKSLLPVLKSMARSERQVSIVLASDGGEADEHRAYARANGLDRFPYVLSEALGKSYGVSKLPYAVLIRPDGRIASLGIVNSREHLESLFEAEALGVASIQDYLARDRESPLYVDATSRDA